MASEFFQAVTAGRAAMDGVKMLQKYAEEVKDIQKRGEFMRIIGQLSIDLAETQIKLAECMGDNSDLKEKIKELEKKLDNLKNPSVEMEVKDGAYYTKNGDGPFCTACYDSKRQAIRLAELLSTMQVLGKYKCPACKTNYGKGLD